MYEILKKTAENNGWSFNYGRRDFHNLIDDADPDKVYLLLDPVTIDTNFDEMNNIESMTYSGSFMVLLSSDFNEYDYETRYNKYILPAINNNMSIIKEELSCRDIEFNTWRSLEAINLFDVNLDGIIITYNITENL